MDRAYLFVPILIAAGLVVTRADEGRIPLATAGSITTPGDYILTRDIAVSGGDALTIDAQYVTVDLNEHRISSTSTADPVIRISPTANHVVIRNGRLSGGGFGVFSNSTADLSLKMDRLAIDDVATFAIDIAGAVRVELTDSRLQNNAGEVLIGGLAGGPVLGRVVGNTISQGLCLAVTQARGLLVSDNVFSGCASNGLQLGQSTTPGTTFGGNLVVHNTFTHCGIGLVMLDDSGGNLIKDNTFLANATGIIAKSAANRIEGNTFFGSTSSASCGGGICVQGPRNLIEGNAIGGSSANCGINLYGAAAIGNSYRNNMLRDNALGGVCLNAGATATNDGGNIF
ncbi:MAG TPA: right-handed parallel beta-helix repeat-containing protein [Dongiaceae bacterium]|nr:right-handed parallel beta-helix repeat-containing protein [Dongiaceae bacterium]